MRVTNIEWDTTEDGISAKEAAAIKETLPTEIALPDILLDYPVEDVIGAIDGVDSGYSDVIIGEIIDYLSNQYPYCIRSFKIEYEPVTVHISADLEIKDKSFADSAENLLDEVSDLIKAPNGYPEVLDIYNQKAEEATDTWFIMDNDSAYSSFLADDTAYYKGTLSGCKALMCQLINENIELVLDEDADEELDEFTSDTFDIAVGVDHDTNQIVELSAFVNYVSGRCYTVVARPLSSMTKLS